jgi:hypothetical protein
MESYLYALAASSGSLRLYWAVGNVGQALFSPSTDLNFGIPAQASRAASSILLAAYQREASR